MPPESYDLWQTVFAPLLRLICGLSLGVTGAALLETLAWTERVARIGRPFARCAHFGVSAQAAFATAFFSPQAANALLAEAYHEKRLGMRELVLASLFASFPSSLVHLPTLFFLFVPVLGGSTFVYLGISLSAAFLRTLFVFFLARLLLPPCTDGACAPLPRPGVRDAFLRALLRVRKRLPKLLLYTVPVYLVVAGLEMSGALSALNRWLSVQSFWTSLLAPEAVGIVVLQLLAELGSALGAAASLIATGGLTEADVVGALLIGTIVGTPFRAFRHQLPSYAGLFSPALGLRLVLVNQMFRMFFLVLLTLAYFALIR